MANYAGAVGSRLDCQSCYDSDALLDDGALRRANKRAICLNNAVKRRQTAVTGCI